MNAIVIFESLTGKTRSAAELIGSELANAGVVTTVCNITDLDHRELALADIVVVGSWVDGLILFGQRPGRAGRLRDLPALDGKLSAVFCTYAVNPGKTIDKMKAILTDHGTRVIASATIKRTQLEEGARSFANEIAKAAKD